MFHTLVRPFENHGRGGTTTEAEMPEPYDIDDLTYRRSLNLPSTFSLLLLRVPGR